jgi:CheY-like chemotaxis protein
LSVAPARILVVDDSLTIRRALELILKPKGYALEFAVDGAEALARAVSFSPDLILLDYVLPDMRGPDVCAALSGTATSAQTPVILVSAKGASIRQAYQDAQNVVSYITKPFKPAVVQAVVENALARVRAAAPASAVETLEPRIERAAPPSEVPLEPVVPTSVGETFSTLLAQLENAAAADLRGGPNGAFPTPLADLLPSLEKLAAHFGDVSGHLESIGVAPYRLRSDGSFASIAATLLAAHRSLCEAAMALAMAGAPGAVLTHGPAVVIACGRAHPRHAEAAEIAASSNAVLCIAEELDALPHLVRLLAPVAVVGAAGDGDVERVCRRAAACAPEGTRFVALMSGSSSDDDHWASERLLPEDSLASFVEDVSRAPEPRTAELPGLDVVSL